MIDLFQREQDVIQKYTRYLEDQDDTNNHAEAMQGLLNEYAKLLKQLRRVTRMSDRTAVGLNTAKQELQDMVHIDPLTGIYNRRFLEENLQRLLKRLSRSEGGLGVLMIDVDHFKKYNDYYGHSMGDECLKAVATAINQTIMRPDDFVARYGGEEFTVVLPDVDQDGLEGIAERILASIRTLQIPHERSSTAPYVTISVGGTAGIVLHTQTSADYIKQADKALYQAKQTGRNQYKYL